MIRTRRQLIRREVICEMFISKALMEDLVEKIISPRLYLTQIVHSNSKMLFL